MSIKPKDDSSPRIEPLIQYLSLGTDIEQAAFAKKAKTTKQNLMLIAYGHGHCSGKLALSIAEASEFAVRPHDIRPDLYPYPDDAVPPHLRSIATSHVAKNVCGA